MVQNSRKTVCPGALKPVNLPEPVQVEASASGDPLVIKIPRQQVVTYIEDRWKIDDEWWRDEPVSRFYYTVRLSSGQRLIIYRDLIGDQWYKQSY